ncbi:GTP-binding protein [Planktomarina temperata]|nr:GTP-binding protein [Planktomarina temperata]
MDLGTDIRVPVTVVTGYLGAGKTTLLNYILKGDHGRKFAVIVNEFGDVGIDSDLIETGEEELIELSSGCLCCVVRGDLIRTLRSLLKGNKALDGILIETTGVANPSPVIQTFSVDQLIAGLARLDAVVTVVDAVHIAARLEDSVDAADQVALASVIVLNKVADGFDVESTEKALRDLNPHAQIHRTNRGVIDHSCILDTHSFSLERIAVDMDITDHRHDHVAANGIACVALESKDPLDDVALEAWLERLLMLRGADILRLKGVLNVEDQERRIIIQSVHMMYEGVLGAPWSEDVRSSRMVIIGRNLDRTELTEGLASCRALQTA